MTPQANRLMKGETLVIGRTATSRTVIERSGRGDVARWVRETLDVAGRVIGCVVLKTAKYHPSTY